MPYGGSDTRVFITRPHIAVKDQPLIVNSQSLFIETQKGAFFRYAIDSNSSVKMELNLYEVAIVMLKTYRVPALARGLRGSAGSGRGVRTLLEFFSGSLVHHTINPVHYISRCIETYERKYRPHLDLLLKIGPEVDAAAFPGTTETGPSSASETGIAMGTHSATTDTWRGAGSQSTSPLDAVNDGVTGDDRTITILRSSSSTSTGRPRYTDVNSHRLVVRPAAIEQPSTVFPLVQSRESFTSESVDLVTSYEDILFFLRLLQDFTPKSAPTATSLPIPLAGSNPNPPAPYADPALDSFVFDPEAESKDDEVVGRATMSGSRRSRRLNVEIGGSEDLGLGSGSSAGGCEGTKHVRQGMKTDSSGVIGGGSDAADTAAAAGHGPIAVEPLSASMFVVVSLEGLKIVIVDNLLGLHLPLTQVKYDASVLGRSCLISCSFCT